MKFEMRTVWAYLNKLIKKWYIFLGFLPGIYSLFSTYIPNLRIINIPLWMGITFAIILLLIANYVIWLEEWKENEEYRDKEPKLDICFEDGGKSNIFRNKIITKKFIGKNSNGTILDKTLEQFGNMSKAINSLMNSFNGSPTERKVCNELEEEFLPVSLILKNIGNVPAEDINIHLTFPKEVRLLEDLPEPGMRILPAYISRRGGVIIDAKKNVVQLWDKKLLQPFQIEFPEFFISCKDKIVFKIGYTINASELKPDKNKGELTFSFDPVLEEETFNSQKELDEENKIKEDLLNSI